MATTANDSIDVRLNAPYFYDTCQPNGTPWANLSDAHNNTTYHGIGRQRFITDGNGGYVIYAYNGGVGLPNLLPLISTVNDSFSALTATSGVYNWDFQSGAKKSISDLSSNASLNVTNSANGVGIVTVLHTVAGTTLGLQGDYANVVWSTGINETTILGFIDNGNGLKWSSNINGGSGGGGGSVVNNTNIYAKTNTFQPLTLGTTANISKTGNYFYVGDYGQGTYNNYAVCNQFLDNLKSGFIGFFYNGLSVTTDGITGFSEVATNQNVFANGFKAAAWVGSANRHIFVSDGGVTSDTGVTASLNLYYLVIRTVAGVWKVVSTPSSTGVLTDVFTFTYAGQGKMYANINMDGHCAMLAVSKGLTSTTLASLSFANNTGFSKTNDDYTGTITGSGLPNHAIADQTLGVGVDGSIEYLWTGPSASDASIAFSEIYKDGVYTDGTDLMVSMTVSGVNGHIYIWDNGRILDLGIAASVNIYIVIKRTGSMFFGYTTTDHITYTLVYTWLFASYESLFIRILASQKTLYSLKGTNTYV